MWNAILLSLGLFVIFVLSPSGWANRAVRVAAFCSALLLYGYWYFDVLREMQSRTQSARMRQIEKYIVLGAFSMFLIVLAAVLAIYALNL